MSDRAGPSRPAGLTVDRELDCRGLLCPLPARLTERDLAALAPGQVLKVVATDPLSVLDMAALSHRTGHPIVDQSEEGGEYVFYFQRVQTAADRHSGRKTI